MLRTGNQLKAGRALAGMDQITLAEAAGVNVNTVRNMERCSREPLTSSLETVLAVERALERAGVIFTDGAPGVKLSLYIVDGVPAGDDYRFECEYLGRRFFILMAKSLIDAVDADRYPDQPRKGRIKRMTAVIGAKVLQLLQQGRRPSEGVLQLDKTDFADLDASA